LKKAIAIQILLEFLLDHYVVSTDGVSLKSVGGTLGGSLASVKKVYRHPRLFAFIQLRAVSHEKFAINGQATKLDTICPTSHHAAINVNDYRYLLGRNPK
jgi:hypothetical protein